MEHFIIITPSITIIALIVLIYYQNKRIDILENKVKNLEVNQIGEE